MITTMYVTNLYPYETSLSGSHVAYLINEPSPNNTDLVTCQPTFGA